MRIVSALLILSLSGWLVPGERAEAQPAPRRSLVGGSWHGTIVQAGIPVKAVVEFHGNGTYSGTLTMPPWCPFARPAVGHVSGKWWLEDANTLVLLGGGGFRGSIHWGKNNNALESFEPLTGTRVRWHRRR